MERQNKARLVRLLGGLVLIGGTCLFLAWYHPDLYPALYPHVLSIGSLTYLSLSRYRQIWWSLLLIATVGIWWFAKAPSVFIAIFAVAKLAPLLGAAVFVLDLVLIYQAHRKYRKP